MEVGDGYGKGGDGARTLGHPASSLYELEKYLVLMVKKYRTELIIFLEY